MKLLTANVSRSISLFIVGASALVGFALSSSLAHAVNDLETGVCHNTGSLQFCYLNSDLSAPGVDDYSHYLGRYPDRDNLIFNNGGPSPLTNLDATQATTTYTWWEILVDGVYYYYQSNGSIWVAITAQIGTLGLSPSYLTRITDVNVVTSQVAEIGLPLGTSTWTCAVSPVAGVNFFVVTDWDEPFDNQGSGWNEDTEYNCGDDFYLSEPGYVHIVEFDTSGIIVTQEAYTLYGNLDGETTISGSYFINQSEIIPTVSEKNPTLISFSLSKRPSTTVETRGESIDNTASTGTVDAVYAQLDDGTYDVLVKFGNLGCSLGTSSCPFPLSYILTDFMITAGVVTFSTTSNEQYNNVVVPSSVQQYEDCGITEIGGCINNSLRFLFIPSTESISELANIKDDFDGRIPFVYVTDIRTVADELFDTAQAETLDVELDLGFGTVTLIDGSTSIVIVPAVTPVGVYSIAIEATSASGAWKVTTGAGSSVMATGIFS